MEGNVLIPVSSIELAEDIGVRMHTNHQIFMGPAVGSGPNGGMTPDQIRAFYGVSSSGGHDVIAVVDAWDYPTALNDFNYFSNHFGLPQELGTNTVFQVVYAGGTKPSSSDPGAASWNQEAAVDIQWAHAMAPSAKIVLVEAASDSDTDLLTAVDTAAAIANVKEISMSWASSEFAGETSYDTHFNLPGPVFFNAAGDSGGVTSYPACSQYVVAVGGTSVTTDGSGNWSSEAAWSQGGGGNSQFVSKPSWQERVTTMTGGNRGVPDISSDADPLVSGVAMYDSTPYKGPSGWEEGWLVVGGTSVSAPCVAGMVNASGIEFTSTAQFLTTIYENYWKTPYPFRDIITGNNGFPAGPGWDYATGVGTPQGTGSFTLNTATVTGLDLLNLAGNFGTSDPSLALTGDEVVSLNDLNFMLLLLGW
jgi:subtilase family serine protease